ncbi:MAG TPA: MerR family transcriptional regulator [Dehalococcoidia bacterium]|nr:MerR family transcriptional regulator [Dehalococcoidia bacterium]
MPLTLNGRKFYRTSEACAKAGISRMTLLRWFRDGSFPDVEHRDWRGWRLFTNNDVARLKAKVHHVQKIGQAENNER